MSEYYVSILGDDTAAGTKESPFRTISKAAKTAVSGDRVIVREGVYREWVKPEHGGQCDINRITYESAPGERAVIKGSERIQSWEPVEKDVWKTVIPDTFFGDYNPYKEVLQGDWLISPKENLLHPGEVYMDGKAFYEARTLEEVKHPVMRTDGENPPWTCRREKLLCPQDSLYQWYTESDGENTVIYANFQGENPNEVFVEINVRKCCFYPEKTGMNYITVRGFEMAQAACPWTPPTADQPGLLGTNWSRGWIIEDNIIHDAKCSGISIGKEASTGHNLCTRTHRKPGYQYQMEAVFRAKQIGWSKETIGSHIIRGNVIYDCGQNGIVGHLGCIFSRIYNNHIYNIAVKHEFFGYEIAGIKLHAAIDVQIHNNNIHNCTLGTWLDWQAQGTRVSSNLYYENDRDLMVEVTHGPYLVDNNIFASEYNFDNIAQGGAYIHNLCCGSMRRCQVLDRSTPYHFPHTTDVAGTTIVYSGDDRIYQNIFLGGVSVYTEESAYGTERYTGHPSSLENYVNQVTALGNGDEEQFRQVSQPVYINGNIYLNGAKPYENEQECYVSAANPQVKIDQQIKNAPKDKSEQQVKTDPQVKTDSQVKVIWEDNETKATFLELKIDKEALQLATHILESKELGTPRITEAPYETPEGTPITFDIDYLGKKRGGKPVAGPLEEIKEGWNRIRVWG